MEEVRVSDLETRPREYVSAAEPDTGPEELLLTARKVYLGKTTEVARALPDRQIRMIGAWCFLDHYGPEDVSRTGGMQVWAHPHTGLQTVSWLFEGEVEHRDSLGSRVTVRPGELNIMTAGRGIVHSEMSRPDRPPRLHGVQLWVALPDHDRDTQPRFETYADLPDLVRPGVRGKILVGELDGVRSPTRQSSPLCGADLQLEARAAVELSIDPTFEYGVFVVAGSVLVESSPVAVDQLLYLGTGRGRMQLSSSEGSRLIILGGLPFDTEIVMWWNFIGRSHEEIEAFRQEWAGREARFPPVVDATEKVMEAPPLPTVVLKPRPRRGSTR
jgi:redox-sensitive bicupin YhaK (pirin superfamily)